MVAALLLLGLPPLARAFSLADVEAQARQLAERPYQPPATGKLTALDKLSYDAYRDIRYRPERALWRAQKLPFELMFFHVGHSYRHPVRVFEINEDRVAPLGVPTDNFDFGRNAGLLRGAGPQAEVAGLRVHYPLNRKDYKDELVVFLGASYFRTLGAGQQYGLSARGLAVNVSSTEPEEFPRFDTFWVERPARNAKRLVIYARLDSPRLAGAYRFEITPGATTQVAVQSRIFLRRSRVAGDSRVEPPVLGLAPLTSMFLSGESRPRPGDFRPEVHDSDGLQVQSATGEWIWRPLLNPERPQTTSFSLSGLKGFGLLQRDRRFASYEDLEARYERRPSVWIEPRGQWGAGRVELMQYHTADEASDNTVAYWVPAKLPPVGQPLALDYVMHWFKDAPPAAPGAWAVQSRCGAGHEKLAPNEVQYHIDFTGPALERLPRNAKVQAAVSASANGTLRLAQVQHDPALHTWRLTLRAARQALDQPLELRAHLVLGREVLTETWSLALPPLNPGGDACWQTAGAGTQPATPPPPAPAAPPPPPPSRPPPPAAPDSAPAGAAVPAPKPAEAPKNAVP
ncbi:MAG: glucan biosynthesis protein G [Burkholderiales bacterium]